MSETETDWEEKATKQKNKINLIEVTKDKLTNYL